MRALMTAVLFCLALGASLCSEAAAQGQPQWTAIYVTDMHCEACAKKIARKLYAVASVKEVRANVPKDRAYVLPEQGRLCSPKAMWMAVESAGFKVVKLTGPAGTFTSQPPQ